jgi:penicillin-binding protein 1A
LGMDKVTATAHAMGITSPLSNLPSEVLGAVAVSPLEMADAYATIASGGIHHPATAITKVVFSDHSVDNLGEQPGKRVFTPGEAYAATQVLKTVIQSGTGTAADYGCPAAGKTGTTSNFTDAYFDGYTPQLATAVWVGYPNSTTSMNDVNGLGPGFGGTLAAPIWHDYMSVASNGYCGDFPTPAVPFHGTAFFGKYATTGGSSSSSGSSSGAGSTVASSPGTSTTTAGTSGGAASTGGSSPYNNPSLYSKPPQAANQHGNGGNGNGSGNGNGNKPGSGGAGTHH